ncbi:MAG: hypothetical protein IT573_09625 [Deltaproteobacteria bacterium]|nr:hypothetical protein [Deltaproteobacteria bacterium]
MAEKDPLIEVNRRAMEFIWNKVPKEVKNGVEYVTYVATDIPFLYYSGLVDTVRFTRAEWEKAFEDCRGEDGRYWISHEKMLWLGRFRYCKVVNEPFDPLKMRTGKYSVDRLWNVFEKSIIPSCSLPPEFMKNVFDQMFRQQKSLKKLIQKDIEAAKEKSGKEVEGINVDDILQPATEKVGNEVFVELSKEHLERLKQTLDTYPSPRRKLEMSVQETRLNRLQQLSDIAKNPQKSTFEAGKDFRETTKKSLKDMLVKASENATAGRKPTGEVLDVKSLQNKRPTKF